MSFILALIVAMLAADLLWWRWAHRALRQRKSWRRLIDVYMLLQLACLIWILCGRFFGSRGDEWIPKPIAAAVFIWHFIFLAVAGILFLIHRIAKAVIPRPAAETNLPSRRDLLRTVAIATPPIATILATGVSMSQLNNFRIRKLDLPISDLPAALDGLTIAHVSDIHVGRFTSGNVLRKIVDATNNLRADIVILSGDLIDHSLADLPIGLDMVRRMDSRFGSFMCEGNHDLFESRSGFETGVKNSGVPLLVNESTMLNIRNVPVQLLGLRWGSLNRSYRRDAGITDSMQDLLRLRDPDAFAILLAHHPHAFDAAVDAKIPLTLSGHTHGGQLMLSQNIGVGPMMFKYWSGLYENGASKMVVSNGVGNWFPLRINAPAEIVHITLRKMFPRD